MMNGSSIQDPTKITSSKFDELLNKGQIEKVNVFNKSDGEAFLTAAALKDKANKKIAKDVFGNPNKGPHYTFEIADAQNFENKLIKAKNESKLKEYDFKIQGDWTGILMNFLPIILIIGVWIF
ncbi:MAG TPA: peptidase M41, partial [Flavobacterium sp.]|nr:peptidase M41 [Flavobacterium sp.]